MSHDTDRRSPPQRSISVSGETSRTSLPEAVYGILSRRILNNEYGAGERLLEANMAEEFGVSRTTLRSALRYLASENLVELTQRRGCFVARMDRGGWRLLFRPLPFGVGRRQ